MNLEELKQSWKEMDQRLLHTQQLNEKIIVSMITTRSTERFTAVRRNYIIGLLWITVCLSVGVAILLGNPFDYTLRIQFAPVAIYIICLTAILFNMIQSYLRLNKIDIQENNIDASLIKIIAVYEKPNRLMHYVLSLFFFSSAVLFPLSFLPKDLADATWWSALSARLIPISISCLLLFLAYKLGAFKPRSVSKFKGDLGTLQSMLAELREK
jgi:hypothetical protein